MLLPKFKSPSEKEISKSREEVFSGNGMYIFRSVIGREDALKIKDYLLIKNPQIFTKVSEEGNHRLFFYPRSPIWHPPFIEFLWEKICYIRNDIYEGHSWFESYKERNNLKDKSSSKILDFQRHHSWASFFWYKSTETHFKHLDGPGELACFLILSEKGKDYIDGGLYIYKDESDDKGILVDDDYNLGDLLVFNQSNFYHEVKNLVIEDGIGRFQLYVPNIPDGRINDYFTFEGSNKVFYSRPTNFFKKIYIQINQVFKRDKIHYSRKAVEYHDSKSPKFNS